jgi:hypothetical protein
MEEENDIILSNLISLGTSARDVLKDIKKTQNPMLLHVLFSAISEEPKLIENKLFRRQIVLTIRTFKPEQYHSYLSNALSSDNKHIRLTAMLVICPTYAGKYYLHNNEIYKNKIIDLTKDEYHTVRGRAISAISEFDGEDVKKIVQMAQEDPSMEVKLAAFSAMKNFESAQDFFQRILRNLLSDIPELSNWATRTIINRISSSDKYQLNEDESEKIWKAFKDIEYKGIYKPDNYKFSNACVKLLAYFGDEKCVDYLLYVVNDHDDFNNRIAVERLSTVNKKKVVKALIEHLRDSLYHRRVRAARALENYGGEAAINAFENIIFEGEDTYFIPVVKISMESIKNKNQ